VRDTSDDAHDAAAIGTGWTIGAHLMAGVCGRRLDIVWWRLSGIGEKGAAEGELGGAVVIGHEAEVTDAMEAVGQRMKQKAANELAGLELHDLGAAVVAIVFPSEGDLGVVEGDQAAVGDGDAVRVAAEIGENLRRSAERLFGVDDPCDRKSSGEENEHDVLKPFIAIQRVQLPPGKGEPTSRKRALHGVWQHPS
jgi:hypothetical protein